MNTLLQDIRYGFRMLVKTPGLTCAVVVSLALGIGANTAIFSLIDTVLFKLLPVAQPEQLYFIQNVGPRRPGGGAPPYPCFERLRDQNRSFNGLAAFTSRDLRVRVDGEREEVNGQFVSGNYFSLLGINPLLGRVLNPIDDSVPEKGGPDGYAAVISHNYWTRRFGRNPAVVGKIVQIGNDAVTIVGVTPPEFYGLNPGTEVDISIPMMFQGTEQLADKNSWWFKAVGRLKPGVPVEQAQAELNAVFQPFMNETTTLAAGANTPAALDQLGRLMLAVHSEGRSTGLVSDIRNELRATAPDILVTDIGTLNEQIDQSLLQERLVATLSLFFGLLALLLAGTGLYGVMAYNVARRRREIGIRIALGAQRGNVVGMVLKEAGLVVLIGVAIGLGTALATTRFISSLLFGVAANDPATVTFAAIVLIGAATLAGYLPARRATKVDPLEALRYE